jgi:HPt (histidine-containing phosphotransfer) domain-containing protein
LSLPPDFIKDLQKEYISTFPEKTQAIQKAFDLKDWSALLSHFHKLAGSGATYSMPEITTLCRKMEDYLDQNPKPKEDAILRGIELLNKIFKSRANEKVYELNDSDINFF